MVTYKQHQVLCVLVWVTMIACLCLLTAQGNVAQFGAGIYSEQLSGRLLIDSCQFVGNNVTQVREAARWMTSWLHYSHACAVEALGVRMCVCVWVCLRVSIGLTEHTGRELARVGLKTQGRGVCMCACVCVCVCVQFSSGQSANGAAIHHWSTDAPLTITNSSFIVSRHL